MKKSLIHFFCHAFGRDISSTALICGFLLILAAETPLRINYSQYSLPARSLQHIFSGRAYRGIHVQRECRLAGAALHRLRGNVTSVIELPSEGRQRRSGLHCVHSSSSIGGISSAIILRFSQRRKPYQPSVPVRRQGGKQAVLSLSRNMSGGNGFHEIRAASETTGGRCTARFNFACNGALPPAIPAPGA